MEREEKNSVALVRERTIPTERSPPVGEVSANWYGMQGFRIPDSHLYTVTNTRHRIGTVFSPDDGHIVARNM